MGTPSRIGLWSGLLLCGLLVALTDGLILVASPTPYLFGIIDAFLTRFEETLLYLPVVKNYAINAPLAADFTGLRQLHMLAPFPYVTIAFAKLLSCLAGGSLNGTVMSIHALLLVEFAAAYYLCSRIIKEGTATLLVSLLLVFGLDLLGLFINIVTVATTTTPLILTAFGFATIFSLALVIRDKASRWQLCFLAGVLSIAAIAFDLLSRRLLGTPWVSDFIATRFFSPLIPFCFLFTALAALLVADFDLTHGRINGMAVAMTIGLTVINFYVYFGNVLIMTPIVAFWLLLRWRDLRQDRSYLMLVIGFGTLFSLPFAWTIIASRHIPAASDYLYRAGNFGIQTYHRFNFPPLKVLCVNLVLLAVPCIILLEAEFRRHCRIGFREWMPTLAYALSVAAAYANYVFGEVIPQAQLMLRYWVPLAILSWLAALVHLPASTLKSRLARPPLSFAASSCIAAAIGIWIIGRWNAHNLYSGPAMVELAEAAEAVAGVATPEDVLVSDWQSLMLLAPSYGLKNLSPNPIFTIATNQDLVERYADLSKLLGRSTDDFLRFVGNIDRWGPVHEANASTPKSLALMSQTSGVAYPMPPIWLNEHEVDNRRLYESLDISQVANRYHTLLICLLKSKPIPELASNLVSLGKIASLECWRRTQQSPF